MGADAYVHAYIGVEVEDSAFYTTHTTDKETCPKGHTRQEGDGAFCGEDGGKFEARSFRTPTEGFKEVVSLLEWEPGGDTWEDGWEDCYQGLWEENYLFNTGSVISSMSEGGETGIGVRIADFGDGGSRYRSESFSFSNLEDQFGKVSELLEALGVKGEPRLFLQLYWSV